MKRFLVLGVMIILVFPISSAWAQKEVRLSMATGGIGGVYDSLGRVMADIYLDTFSVLILRQKRQRVL